MWLLFAAALVAIHAVCLNQYGIFRDEFYYIACSKRLAWGYVDHPPLSIFVLALVRRLFGESLIAIRLVPVAAGAATLFCTGWLTREMGGGRYAQSLAMTSVLFAPVVLGIDHYYSMNALDILFWAIAMCLYCVALRSGALRVWLLLGVTLGLALLNKHSVLWLIAGLTTGLLSTSHRRSLRTRGPWLAAGIAALIVAPHLAWQIGNGWPTREFVHNATSAKMQSVPPLTFLLDQLLNFNPLSSPLWIGGLLWAVRTKDSRRRAIGIMFLTVAAILIVSGKSRAYYLSPAYSALFAASAGAFERFTAARRRTSQRAIALGLPALGGLAILPMAIPILPANTYIAYSDALRISPRQEEYGRASRLPQHYADMFGWKQMAVAVAEVYHRLPPEERKRCAIYGHNYGEAGAIDYFGPELGLPPAISRHNNYWLWGPRNWDGQTLIVINRIGEDGKREFESIEQAKVLSLPFAMPYEDGAPIYIARRLRRPVPDVWKSIKLYE